MEAIPFTTYQERKFRDDGGFVNEVPNNRPDTWTDDVMIYWTESFEDIQVILDGVLYTKFALFKKIYESLPEYLNLSQSDAEKR